MMRVLVVIALALVIAQASRADAGIAGTSPGPLAAAHAAFESQCERCHVPFGGVPASKCLACHPAIADRLARNLGFHPTVKDRACADCHKEHRGRAAAMMPAPSPSFDHRTTGFPLDGDHALIACNRCHGPRWLVASTRPASPGEAARPNGSAGLSCANCHADRAHRGALGSDCARCHRPQGWTPTLHPVSAHRTPLTGGHARLACADCHRAGTHLAAERSCATCHAQPHGGTTAACDTCHRVAGWKQVSYRHAAPLPPGKHQTASCLSCHPSFQFRASRACASCHERDRKHEPLGACASCHSPLTWRDPRFDHAQSFPLTDKHAAARCDACHRQPGRFTAPRACEGCHRDPHDDQFARRDRAQLPPSPISHVIAAATRRTCASCHTTAGWRPSTIARVDHAFPLRGKHATTACRDCHADGRFTTTSTRCADCHIDARHRGRFGTDCASCHDETAWSRTPAFDHATTGFALDHAHAKRACADCHGSDGLRLARAASPKACQTCHTARHGLVFGTQCTSCHNTTSFRDTPPFDHATTGFPLELRHAALPCVACHDAQRRPAVNRTCRTCHGDPHRGSNALDCADCHRADRWRIIRFDHQLTGYPLVGRHRLASCGGCHTNPNWTGVRTDCAACHAFDRPRTSDHLTKVTCDDCHTPVSWRRARPF